MAKAQELPSLQPWWDEYPRFVQTDNLKAVQDLCGSAGFGTGEPDPSWGIYGQRIFGKPQTIQVFQKNGLKFISYYETYGTATCFIIELDSKKEGMDHTPVKHTHWNWKDYSGGPIRWVGPQNYFDCEDFAGVYTRKHPRYGGRAMTYPDGRIASGYKNNDPTDPRNSLVLDAGGSKTIYGTFFTDQEIIDECNIIDPNTGKPKTPLKGLLKVPGRKKGVDGYTGHMDFGKDTACPMWIDQQYASVLYGADNGLDGIWTDNFGPWNSFCAWPLKYAFGEWSVALFRDYLKKNFSGKELHLMGVTDLENFDIRAALIAQYKAWGGKEGSMGDKTWNDARWLDDPLWRAYKIYKRQIGTKALSKWYRATKAAAAKAGKPDFLVAGNDVPCMSLGWARTGELDLASMEMGGGGWNLVAGSYGFPLPPVGRFSPIYKLAVEFTKSRCANAWFYFKKEVNKPGISNVLEYEMLANNTLPMVFPFALGKVAGDDTSNAEFFKFVSEATPVFGKRVLVQDVGLYHSTSSLLAFMTPNAFHDFDSQPHNLAYYGWGAALGNLQYQYRPIPEWKLNSEALKKLRVLIIPDSEVFDQADVDNILIPWVKAGGRLIVTGMSGYRAGESGNFGVNGGGLSLGKLTGVSNIIYAPEQKLSTLGAGKVLYLRDNIGMSFYKANQERVKLLPHFEKAMDEILKDQPPMLLTAADMPGTVGLTLHEDTTARRFFIDLNNMNLDANDVIHATPAMQISVALPGWLKGVSGEGIKTRVLSPDAGTDVQMKKLSSNRAELTISPVKLYASVVLEAAQTK